MKPGVRSGCELAYERATRTHMRTVDHETILNHGACISEPKQCKMCKSHQPMWRQSTVAAEARGPLTTALAAMAYERQGPVVDVIGVR